MRRLILASGSPYRRELLSRLGLTFETMSPDIDERSVVLPPVELAETLAERKARAVAATHPDAVIIGSDQVPALGDDILTKPGTSERAVAQLQRLAGREHTLITAVAVLDARSGVCHSHVDVHRMTMRALTEAECRDYVARDQPLDCAGSYKIESLGIALMASIAGDDFTAITGLPLIATIDLLARHGVRPLAVE